MAMGRSYQFGPYTMVPDERVLLREGRPIQLPPKAFDTLLVLIKNRGHLIGRDQLMTEVWPKTCVEEANLTQNIFTLRKAFGRDPQGGKYIETVARRGYRFAAEVLERPVHTATSSLITNSNSHKLPNSLAVLPFTNGSDDAKMEYLANGITESTINNLSQLHQLKVMSRSAVFRYEGSGLDARTVGQELGVAYVLVGHVRQMESRWMVWAELVDVKNGWQLWGKTYSLASGELFHIQEEISRQISAALRLKLTINENALLAKRPTQNAEAYHQYLRGRYYWEKYSLPGLERALDYFSQAITLDPNFALAYVGIADSYFRLSTSFLPPKEALVRAKSAIVKALEIDGELAEARASMGMIKMRYDWDWKGAEQEFLQALDLKSTYSQAHQWYATFLESNARFDEALSEMKTALELDPLSLQIGVSLAVSFWKMRKYDTSLRELRKIVDFEPNFQPARLALGVVFEQLFSYNDSVANFELALRMGKTSMIHGFLGRVYALMGNKQKANEIIRLLQKESRERFVSNYSLALIFAALNNSEQAFDSLYKAFEDKDEFLSLLRVDPRLDNLRPDPRFSTLLVRMGLG